MPGPRAAVPAGGAERLGRARGCAIVAAERLAEAGVAETFFSVDAAPPGRRLDAWRAAISETFVRLDCEADRRAPLSGSVASRAAGETLASHVRSVAQAVRRTPRLIRRDGAEVMLVSFQLSGRGLVAQDGREARLGPGEFALYDSTRPYALAFEEPFDQLVLHMPRAALAARLGRPEALTARRIGGGGPARAAAAYLAALGPALREAGPEEAAALGRAALDLVALALGREAGALPPGGAAAEALRRRAKLRMAERIGEPGLGLPDLAAALGVSPRRLQEAFAEAGETPSGWLRERRLALAAERLRAPAWAGASVTGIAFGLGFADPSAFARAFAARFGESPRAWRRAGPPPL